MSAKTAISNSMATLALAAEHDLKTDFLDTIRVGRNCPGFNLFIVEVAGERHLVAADCKENVDTRIYLRTNGAQHAGSIEFLAANPDKVEWERQSGF